MKNKTNIVLIISFLVFIVCLGSCSKQIKAKEYDSASYKRFKENKLRYEKFNEFLTDFKFSEVKGIGYEKGVTRRDPSSIIKVDSLYYVWYTRPQENTKVVGIREANESSRAYAWDLSDIWYATSPDGYNWTEKGIAVNRGEKGRFDARTVCTADILVANNKYYLFYQAAATLEQGRVPVGTFGGDFLSNKIGMSWASSPNGPWHRMEEPILAVGAPDQWDGNVVHDPSLIVRGGKYWMYYKSSPRTPYIVENLKGNVFSKKYGDIVNAWGVAIADNPEGPYIKSKYNPVVVGGHEVIVWPYKKGVCAFVTEGPERNSIQFSEDGVNFYPVAHGLQKPEAAGFYRPSNFTDTDSLPGQGVTWGLSHVLGESDYLRRVDCDLSLKKAEKVNANYQQTIEWMNKK
ncbi:glycoside hydrolase family 117 protein [Pedobacter sp.]|uniref:glycoside hydrolase family 117 protein n=1 Tax=Pedobacter sp. TaxID=1411316 RepID=UPI003C4FCD2F